MEWRSGETSDFFSESALTIAGGPILMYVPEVVETQTQLLLEDHTFELYRYDDGPIEDLKLHTNHRGDWISFNYPDPYPNIYGGNIKFIHCFA